ncbi:AMP-binding protein [Massilia sp. YIM B04103]|uniref:AMP-binding protein n=1 Tax=Massilia sp. YIM B04103 TaxID=2963106 RepID=UPI00210E9BED|nr:AMP-binding protein [Massilia sp. YIM B04103]
MMPDSLSSLVPALLQRDPAACVGWRADQPLSHAWLLARVRAWSALLAGQPGRDYALYLDDSLEFGAALLGAWQAGKTVWLTADTLDASCAALQDKVDGFLGQFPPQWQPLAAPGDMAPEAGAAPPPHSLAGDFPALVVHTSGSTGAAQAVPKRLSQLASEVAVLERMFGARLGDAAIVATVSHQHIYGLLFKVLWPLCAARPLQALSVQYPEELAQALAQRASVLVSSPAHLKRLPAHLDWTAAADRLRAMFSSGGPLPEEAALAAGVMLGQVPLEIYGSSETGGVAWRQRAPGAAASVCWQAFPNVEWRIATDAEQGEGALEVRSPHLPDADWLALADRARPAGPQAFELLGRADRIVKVEEKRVSLDALEAALLACGLAEQARIVPDDGARVRLAAFVVLNQEGKAELAAQGKAALNQRLRAALAPVAEAVALPRRWRYLDSLPLNAQGKTTRAALLALLDEEPAALEQRPRQPHWRELERGEQRLLLELSVPPDLLYFEGHFPGSPILPGVAQLDWAIGQARQAFDVPPVFREVAALKFQQVIVPGATVQLELLHDRAKASVQFRYLSAAGQHASGRLLFSAP